VGAFLRLKVKGNRLGAFPNLLDGLVRGLPTGLGQQSWLRPLIRKTIVVGYRFDNLNKFSATLVLSLLSALPLLQKPLYVTASVPILAVDNFPIQLPGEFL